MKRQDVFEKLYRKENLHFCIYSMLLRHESDAFHRKRLEYLARTERKHMEVWKGLCGPQGAVEQKDYLFLPILFLLGRKLFGKEAVSGLINAYESSSLTDLLNIINEVPADRIKPVVDVVTDELYNETVHERREGNGILSHIREVVFGMNDGLVEVLAAVAGLVGIYRSNLVAALAGLIIGISGTLSMAVGAFLSSTSAKDVSASEVTRLQLELEAAKERISKELGKSYKHYRNLGVELDSLIKKLKDRNDPFYRLLQREKSTTLFRFFGKAGAVLKHGDDTSPFKDAVYVGIFYMVGAIIPLASFFIGALINDPVFLNLIISLVAASIAIVITAALIAINTNENVLRRVSQSLLLSLAASGVTFLIGSLVSSYIGVVV